MPHHPSPVLEKEYLTVSEAARMLGVASSTMRNWDRAGKLRPVRHPLNGYRLYKKSDLESVINRISNVTADPSGY